MAAGLMQQSQEAALETKSDAALSIKSPLVCIAVGLTLGVVLFLLHAPLWASVLPLVPLAASLVLWRRRAALVALLLAGITAGQLYATVYDTALCAPARTLANTTQVVTCEVQNVPSLYDRQQRVSVVIRGGQLGTPFSIHTLLYLPRTEETLSPGDLLTVKADFYKPNGRDGFDAVSYYRANGYDILSRTKDAPLAYTKAEVPPLSAYPKLLAQRMKESVRAVYDTRDAAFLTALLFGDKSHLDTLDYSHLRKSGLAHIAAVSGLHVGFLMTLLIFLLGRRWGSILGLPVLLGFWIMAGGTPSVTRACIVYAVMIGGYFLEREAAALDALSLALLILIVWKPAGLLSVGLQLSFASTLGILLFNGRLTLLHGLTAGISKKYRKLRHRVGNIASVVGISFCAALGTMPLMLWHFGYLSILSPLSNPLALWAVSLLFPLAFLGSLLGIVSPPLGGVLAVPVHLLIAYVNGVAARISRIPVGLLYADNRIDLVVLVLLCAACMLLLWAGKGKWGKIGVTGVLICLLALCVLDTWTFYRQTTVTVFAEGDGGCAVVTHRGCAVIVDCGSTGGRNAAEDAAEYLDWHGFAACDAVIVTAQDEACTSNLQEMLNAVDVRQLVTATSCDDGAIRKTARQRLTQLRTVDHTGWTAITGTVSVHPAGDGTKLLVRAGGDGGALFAQSLTPQELADCGENSCAALVVNSEYIEQGWVKTGSLSPERIVVASDVAFTPYGEAEVICPSQTGDDTFHLSS